MTGARSPLVRDARGAAMVEFLAAFFPLMLLFLCLIELSRFAIAELMLQRAAGIAVRACAVIKDQPLHCDGNEAEPGEAESEEEGGEGEGEAAQNHEGQDEAIREAAREALQPLGEATLRLEQDETRCTTGHGEEGESGTDEVEVHARFLCAVPLARDILCSTAREGGAESEPSAERESFLALSARAKYAHQGAAFDCWYSPELKFKVPYVEWEPPSVLGF